MAIEENTDLNGKRIVVVEDDYLLAADMCRELRELGATVLGPAPTPFYAAQLIGRRKLDAAVLDVRLHGTTVFDVAELLMKQGVPIVFVTAFQREELPPRFRGSSLLEKPLDRKKLVSEIVAMTRRPVATSERISYPPAPPVPREAPAQTFARALARSFGQTSWVAGSERQKTQ